MDNLDELGFTKRQYKMEKNRQCNPLRFYNGMTVIGMLLTVFIVVYIGVTTMKVIPVYIQHYNIEESIESLSSLQDSSLTDDNFANIEVMKSALMRRFEINSINDINERQIVITPSSEYMYTVKIDYKVTRHLFANIDLLFSFSINKQVKINATR